MGSGIAYWLSSHLTQTILHDSSPQALAHGLKTISSLYSEAENQNVISKMEAVRCLDRIHPTLENIPLKYCDLIIESATQQLHIKQQIFVSLSTRCRPDTILATNTSAIPIHQIASVISHPERLIGLHFFNPVHRVKLVEVVRTESTSEHTLATTLAYVRHLGKIPIVVKDSPGFLVNRILMPYLVEAASMFEQGGDPEEIDNAMLDFGMPIGPLRLLDEIGLDVAMHIAQTLANAFPNRMKIPTVVQKLLTTGHTGRIGKSGFYVYDQSTPSVNAQAIGFQTGIDQTPENASEFLSNIMYQEAQLCLQDRITQTPDDIDLAMILATGFPPWRRGFQPLSS
jgi:3-hydroxyacyl-CoA dehydrogenase / enoyl-CoA hydratase / 3-hydroxybutyryl-CoA epimerase